MDVETGVGLAQPLGLLSDCHRRIERFLGGLGRLAEEARGGPLVEEQRAMLDAALRYFEGMARLHTADEEESLFPRLRSHLAEQQPAAGEPLLAGIAALAEEHRQADQAHGELHQQGRRWLAEGHLLEADLAHFRVLLAGLSDTYRQHIEREDGQVFAAARRLLSDAEWQAIGAEMAARRGGMTCAQRKAQQRARV